MKVEECQARTEQHIVVQRRQMDELKSPVLCSLLSLSFRVCVNRRPGSGTQLCSFPRPEGRCVASRSLRRRASLVFKTVGFFPRQSNLNGWTQDPGSSPRRRFSSDPPVRTADRPDRSAKRSMCGLVV